MTAAWSAFLEGTTVSGRISFRSAPPMQAPDAARFLLHCENVIYYQGLILFIDKSLDRKSMFLYVSQPRTALTGP
jgi:hypothetical protein